MKGSDYRAVRSFDREDWKNRAERGVNVNDVILPARENLPELPRKPEPESHPRLRSICVYRLTSTDADQVRLPGPAFDVRRNDIDVMSEPSRLTREEVYVLDNAAKVRIVVLGDERYSEGARERRQRGRNNRPRRVEI